ncbi:MAG: sialate O-acetylesterase [Pseudomonadota bacterium]
MPGHGHEIGFGASSVSLIAAAGSDLSRIALPNRTINELAPPGSTIGILSVINGQGSYTFTLQDDPDNKFTIVGDQLRTGAALDFETATSHPATIRADNGQDDPIDLVTTVEVLNALEGPTFVPLTLSASTATQGEAATINIFGVTAGSTIAGTVPDGMALDSAARTISGTPAVLGEFTFDLTESGLDSEPRTSSVSITVEESASGPPPLDFIAYGQSNSGFWVTAADGSVTAHPDTLVWDRDSGLWVNPSRNGAAEFLNSMQASTGRVCRLVPGGASGVAISILQKNHGSGLYEAFVADIQNSGANPAFIIWHHGESGAAGSASGLGTYQADLDTLHGSLASDLGLTRSTLPIILSSLATTTSPSIENDANWGAMQKNLATINASYPHVHFSHSNVPAVRVDEFHWTPASYGKSGRLSAQRVQVLMGLQATVPNVTLDPLAERVSTATTRVNLLHALGDDFTPVSGITGFEVSTDQANWVAATGAREDADTIILSHANLGTVARFVRYQYGRTPEVSGALLDNSALAVPIQFTTQALFAAGEAAAPVLTYQDRAFVNGAASQSFSISFPNTVSEESLCVVRGGISGNAHPVSMQITAQPSGTVITADEVVTSEAGQRPTTFLYQAVIPGGTTSIDVAMVYTAQPFDFAFYHAWTSPTSGLFSTDAFDFDDAREAAAASVTVSPATSAGGFVIVSAESRNSRGEPTVAGDETYAIREATEFDGSWVAADAQNVGGEAASDVTVTVNAADELVAVAASWR